MYYYFNWFSFKGIVLLFIFTTLNHSVKSIILNELTEKPHLHNVIEAGKFTIYVHTLNESPFSYALGDVYVHLNVPRDKYTIFIGESYDEIRKQYVDHTNNLIDFQSFLKRNSNFTGLPLTKKSYIGILSDVNYSIKAIHLRYNFYRFVAFFVGIFLFYKARDIVKTETFFYSTGIATGLFISIFVVVFIMYRFMPKKTSATVMYFGGWGFVSFVLSIFWDEIKSMIYNNFLYFQFYVGIVVILVLAIFYKNGPPQNVRTINLIQWSFQLISLLLVFFSSQLLSFSITILIILLILNFLLSPAKVIAGKLNVTRKKLFPSPIKPRQFLTMEEYDKEGEDYTRQELEKLRKFCSSPEADAWRIVSRIKESKKLAEFVHDDEDPVTYIGFREDDFDTDSSDDFSDEFVQEQIELLKTSLKKKAAKKQKYPYRRYNNDVEDDI
ncbi:Transmembrane protein 194 family-containing protein [Strongyloides ratti]|uniref:Transmembrane protein 194 family-containing protein n=1 Tax=Strongyloides ratti TaxID=34506 RepID=A0A090LAY7_STRRB|nr:Transmembrane protein 194 family-containing protein [Strongyloides ratti]CEF66922.1 Transmembrane protein 194 family-containing protein [Strongyloides ratti]